MARAQRWRTLRGGGWSCTCRSTLAHGAPAERIETAPGVTGLSGNRTGPLAGP